ncbi:hypothetical protein SEUCBS139899_001344 [Sporothrix eucalyptigena]|uniref:Uncharacterized protein n=1 Tax=Sporothrix eucalyptigena TaxID=1812306 RepID=A0ABP0CIK5_9PEZI
MSNFHLTVGFRADFLVGFFEDYGNNSDNSPDALQLQPDPSLSLIRLPAQPSAFSQHSASSSNQAQAAPAPIPAVDDRVDTDEEYTSQSGSSNENSSSANNAGSARAGSVATMMEDIENHGDGTNTWSCDNLPYTSAAESFRSHDNSADNQEAAGNSQSGANCQPEEG